MHDLKPYPVTISLLRKDIDGLTIYEFEMITNYKRNSNCVNTRYKKQLI